MKTLCLLCSLLLAMAAQAQDPVRYGNFLGAGNLKGQPGTPKLSHLERAAAAAALDRKLSLLNAACVVPFRAVDGVLYDLRPRFQYEREVAEFGWCKTFSTKPLPEWKLLTGKILQIPERDTILLEHKTGEYDFETFLIRNFVTGGAVDGAFCVFFALPDGPSSYTTVLGARKTVVAFDYGIPCTASQKAELEEQARHKSENLHKALVSRAEAAQKEAEEKFARAQEARKKAYEPEAKSGRPYAMVELAKIYLASSPPDLDQARHWLTLAAATGNPEATNLLAAMPKK